MKQRHWAKAVALTVGTMCAAVGGTARADLIETTQSVTFQAPSGWNFYPGTKDSHVIGFLAIQMTGAVPVNGFNVIWYERQSDGTYKMNGWSGADPKAAARSLSNQYAAPRLFAQSDLQSHDCGEATETAAMAEMANGLTLTDPLQPIAAGLPPEVMEAAVQSGAQGATALSAEAADPAPSGGDTTDVYLANYLVITEEWMFGQVNTPPGSGADGSVCLPHTITLRSTSVTTWSPYVTTCANGDCRYTGSTTTTTTTCYQHWDCHLTDCITTITTVPEARTCPPGPGGCAAPPPPC